MASAVTTGEEAPTPQGRRTIPSLSVDSQTLYRRLLQAEVGELITYEELADLIHREVRPGFQGYGNLTTARRLAFNERMMVFGPVRGQGIKRLSDAETVEAGREKLGRGRNSVKAARRILASVNEENLDAATVAELHTDILVAAAATEVTSQTNRAALHRRIENNERPKVADVLRLFTRDK